jgi:formyltetrahydrofolate-dependent phosphoribosylglycinamide formyltransferase
MQPGSKSRIAVLASGGGSNLQALFDHLDALGAHRGGDVVLVASDRAAAGALARARARGVGAAHLQHPDDADSLAGLLDAHDADIVVLAGYLKLVPPPVVRRYHGRMVNVHPSLLPAFGGPGMYGARVHRAVLASGARVSGATVHFVGDEYDRGAIVAQWPVPVFEEDSPASLAARVLRVEHALLPRVVDLLASELLALDDAGRVHGAFLAGAQGEAFSLRAGDTLTADIDAALAR